MAYTPSKGVREHIERVNAWLAEHVQVIPEPKRVTLYDFDVDWDSFSGEFSVAMDGEDLSEKLHFSLDMADSIPKRNAGGRRRGIAGRSVD